MTGCSPKIWAAADLDPISPAPVHPSSPIIVPALQAQADTYVDTSLVGGNPMTSAGVPSAGVPKVNEQSHVPPVTIHSDINTTTDAMDPRPVDLGSTDPDEAVNGVAEKAGTVSVGIHAENMQESETSQPNATEAEQDVSKSNESTHNSDTPHLMSDRANVAASAHENSPPISRTSPDPASISCPNAIPQPSHKLQEGSQTVFDAIVSNVDNTQVSQSPCEQSPANNNHRSSITSHAGYPASNIQALVDNIAARAVDADADATHIPISEGTSSSMVLPQNTILPPKPPAPGPTSTQPYPAADEFPSPIPGASQSSSMPLPLSNGLALGNYTGAAPGMVNPHASGTVIPALTSVPNNHVIPVSQSDSTYGVLSVDQLSSVDHQKKRWEAFLQDERKYVSEAKWDRFPEGSRIFIGNLSSERASKKEVFNIFSKYGRLAQISLKQAYGFVQYHTVAEGQAAMDNLQGMDIRGKKINLEFSRAQKKDSEGNRTNRAKRDSERQDTNRGRRDDYRPGRQASPRRSNHRRLPSYDSNVRGRGFRESSYSSDRRRSQSPGYSSRDSYGRRIPSPYPRYTSSVDLDLPRRYGPEVPDVQFLLLEDVKRDFVSWAQNAFANQGLRVDIMFLNPQFPRDAVIQRQVMEGVHAVAELDFRAQEYGRIPLQVFDRSAGYNNVRFDQYQDLDPAIAAQLVARTKSQSQIPPPPYHGSQYPPIQQYPPSTQGHYMPPSYPNQPYPSLVAPGPGGAPLNPATVHKILGSLNGQQGGQQAYSGGPAVDVNALLATIGNQPHRMGGPPPTQQSTGYTHPPPDMPRGASHGSNSAQHVQEIMTQLARYRQ
ncbi:hypothetical protein F5B21DRAFT_231207 [Xylaria acuta]|nr:hypothetical protein F5B21DRAFT_231207 [Xylaria acuta]